MNDLVEQYWGFAIICLLVALLLLRLVGRERITLQGSISFLVLLAVGAAMALVPGATRWLTQVFGFTLPANLIFAGCILALVALHVSTLVNMSRIELRSVALTQELAILREQLERLQKSETPRATT
jgi:hypothetical protein